MPLQLGERPYLMCRRSNGSRMTMAGVLGSTGHTWTNPMSDVQSADAGRSE